MEYDQQYIFYAKDGEYVTLTDRPYTGFFHKMPSGVLMTGKQHEPNSEVIVAASNRETRNSDPLTTPTLNL